MNPNLSYSTAAISSVKWSTNYDSHDDLWVTDADVYFDIIGDDEIKGLLTVTVEGVGGGSGNITLTSSDTEPGVANFNFRHIFGGSSKPNGVDPWWPNELGNQTLYKLNVTFDTGSDVSEAVKMVGFRKVALVEESEGFLEGLSFNFEVNGVPIFAKGSNWIPAHVLPEQGSQYSIVN